MPDVHFGLLVLGARVKLGDKRLPPRLWAKIKVEGECWSWTGAVGGGVPHIKWGTKATRFHIAFVPKLLWETERGCPAPEGMHGRRKCGNGHCVRPLHVSWEPATGPRTPLPTECPNGHGVYTNESAYWNLGVLKPDGTRYKSRWTCKTCHRVNVDRYMSKIEASPRKRAARMKQRREYFRAYVRRTGKKFPKSRRAADRHEHDKDGAE